MARGALELLDLDEIVKMGIVPEADFEEPVEAQVETLLSYANRTRNLNIGIEIPDTKNMPPKEALAALQEYAKQASEVLTRRYERINTKDNGLSKPR